MIKKLVSLGCLAIAMFVPSSQAEDLYRADTETGYIVLTDQACSHPNIVANGTADLIMEARKWTLTWTTEEAKKEGHSTVEGCYIIEDGWVHTINEFGGVHSAPLEMFNKLRTNSI